MSDTPHPINLLNVAFTRVHVQAIAQHQPGPDAHIGSIENQLQVRESEEEPRMYLAVMRTSVNQAGSPDHPYVVDVECHGVLQADHSLSEEEAQRGVAITAHSVLYGAIRETVAWLTGRQPHGSIMLGLSVLAAPPKPTEQE